jgi:putative acetyltransferase
VAALNVNNTTMNQEKFTDMENPVNTPLAIRLDDLKGDAIASFLAQHIEDMRSVSPPESKHALDLEGLRSPEIQFWSVWEGEVLVSCGALKNLGSGSGEIKSMRTSAAHRGKGIASMLLRFIVDVAVEQRYVTLYLETGSMPFFAAARQLYYKHGFCECAPFGSYREDPNSVFMRLDLRSLSNRSSSERAIYDTGRD